ncbi:ATP-binding protein [Flavobacterium subsaxonicum]|uniref:ATP-binding protein n=1 Tax=Flavobacterium subsaxonicum TaxID=426226 RepID=UPI000A58FFBB|nr:ATP-binding protein [Flavobacterium subsaxonicum]
MEEEKEIQVEINDSISFTVDAGLIDRLGRELVGRSETAVSELVKNAYDADATLVEVKFINSNIVGGTLKIIDNGLGMTREQLRRGFMTISSSDKVHNPISERYQRSKAGRKGIGRFATHRLGRNLTIITQTLSSEKALKLTINWDSYVIDQDLANIKNPVEEIDKIRPEGTELIIDNLRESWSIAEIKRIYRYVSDLFQPDYLSDRSRDLNLAKQQDESFTVNFSEEIWGSEVAIANPDKMIFEKALAVIEGYIDNDHDGFCSVYSNNLELENDIIPILYGKKSTATVLENGVEIQKKIIIDKYKNLKNIHFKVYYFIYNREIYYTNISKTELASVQKIAKEQGGVKLYRNGFRVLPYGERGNDWLGIDKRYFDASGQTNIPSGNQNLFGFVEIVDQEGAQFEETASREGVLENESYLELRDFISKSLGAGTNRIRAQITRIKDENERQKQQTSNTIPDVIRSPIEKLDDLQNNIDDLVGGNLSDEQASTYKANIRQYVDGLKQDFQKLLDELGMTRVLAGLGLTIGEFTHEVVQFSPSLYGDLDVLTDQVLNEQGLYSLENLKRTIDLFTSYTSYFNATVSANVSRELKPQELDVVVTKFQNVISSDLKKLSIELVVEPYGYNLFTVPMHSSEWSSILFNLYTNTKKAIKRRNVPGKIKIIIGKEADLLYLEFLDNGDGVPSENRNRIFDAFFTTSTPAGFDATQDERLTGTGLGLKIVKDIVQTYGGTIDLIEPEQGYMTCIRIEMPLATEKQRQDYAV